MKHFQPWWSGFDKLQEVAMMIRKTVEQWTSVAVRWVAPRKRWSKVANHIAKRQTQATQCVTVLETPKRKSNEAMPHTGERNWGVGGQYAENWRLLVFTTPTNLAGCWRSGAGKILRCCRHPFDKRICAVSHPLFGWRTDRKRWSRLPVCSVTREWTVDINRGRCYHT